MPDQKRPDDDRPDEPEPEPSNRAERRAAQRGKKPPPSAPGAGFRPAGRRDRPVVTRRSGRRGNR